MRKPIKVRACGKVHLTYGRGFNRALCGEAPPFELVKKGAVTCAKCKKEK